MFGIFHSSELHFLLNTYSDVFPWQNTFSLPLGGNRPVDLTVKNTQAG